MGRSGLPAELATASSALVQPVEFYAEPLKSRGKNDPQLFSPIMNRLAPSPPVSAQQPLSTKGRQLPLCPFRLPFLSRPSVCPQTVTVHLQYTSSRSLARLSILRVCVLSLGFCVTPSIAGVHKVDLDVDSTRLLPSRPPNSIQSTIFLARDVPLVPT